MIEADAAQKVAAAADRVALDNNRSGAPLASTRVSRRFCELGVNAYAQMLRSVVAGKHPNTLLEQLLSPQRLVLRAFDDIHRMADAAVSVAATMRLLREDMDALRAAFAGAEAEVEAVRKAFLPEVRGIHRAAGALHEDVENIRPLLGALDTDVKDMGQRLTSEVASLHATIQVLVREADDMRQVVEPLQSATERVGRVADRLPGGGS